MSVIHTIDDLRVAIEQLQALDPRFVRVVEVVGEPPLRRRKDGFESLVEIIVAQQVSRASAQAILARMQVHLNPYTPDGFHNFNDETYVAAGLSKPKIKTFRALSAALNKNELDLSALRNLSDAEVMAALTYVKGIGPWTAEIYLLTCLGRADIWPAGDLALQVGVQMMCELEDRPSADETRKLAGQWQPWRAVAARLIWSYYAHQKEHKKNA